MPILLAFIIPVMVVALTIPDSFAGERERHTLATLLASRLPDRAILAGKILPSVGLAWGFALAILSLGLLTVNLTHWNGALMLYTPTVAIAGIGMSLLMATLAASTGVLISLRIGTVQEASQILMMAFLAPPMVAGPIVMILARGRFKETLGALDPVQVLAVAASALTVITAGLLVAAAARFQRSRLILG